MSSSTATQEDDTSFDKRDSKARRGAPKFIIALHNLSWSPKPRNEAFFFRDGIIIISTPILSVATLFECLGQTCRTFGLKPLSWSEGLALSHSAAITTMIERVQNYAKWVKSRKLTPYSAALIEKRANHRGYFDIPIGDPMTSKPFKPFKLVKCERPSLPKSSPDDGVPTTEHIKEEEIADDRHFQDRLVPNAKMENARRKYIAWRVLQIMNAEVIDQGKDEEPEKPEDPRDVLESVYLTLNDVGRRQVDFAKTHMQASLEVQIRIAQTQASIERQAARFHRLEEIKAWSRKVSEETGLAPQVRQTSWGFRALGRAPRTARASANQSPLNGTDSERRMRHNQDWNKAKLESARSMISDAGDRNEAISRRSVAGEKAANGGQPWPTKILSRHDPIEDQPVEDAKTTQR